jgi:DNA adenine methylase
VEPFAGGGGVGLALLLHGYVDRIVLNDLSEPIYAFWRGMLDEPARFIDRILSAPLTPEEWVRQRETFRSSEAKQFELGFAAFYLNRTNHSGILNGGMIGGHAQSSTFGMDARFNRQELAARVSRIARQSEKISVTRLDAADLLAQISTICADRRPFIYIDPPYYVKGRDLYYDFYKDADHGRLRDAIIALPEVIPWVVSYDNVAPIVALYDGYETLTYDLSYSVRNGRVGREIMFFSSSLTPADFIEAGIKRGRLGRLDEERRRRVDDLEVAVAEA